MEKQEKIEQEEGYDKKGQEKKYPEKKEQEKGQDKMGQEKKEQNIKEKEQEKKVLEKKITEKKWQEKGALEKKQLTVRRSRSLTKDALEEYPDDTYVLFVHKGDCGLPSIDPKSLNLMFFLKINASNVIIQTTEDYTSPKIPCLKTPNGFLYDYIEIIQALEKLAGTLSDNVFGTKVQKESIIEYKAYAFTMLDSAIMLYFWGYDTNRYYLYEKYSKGKAADTKVIFLDNLGQYTREMYSKILDNRPFEEAVAHEFNGVEKFCDFITFLLGSKKFIFGDTPSTLDASVCGYLAPLLKLNLPNQDLPTRVRKYGNVCNYVLNFVNIFGIEKPVTLFMRRSEQPTLKQSKKEKRKSTSRPLTDPQVKKPEQKIEEQHGDKLAVFKQHIEQVVPQQLLQQGPQVSRKKVQSVPKSTSQVVQKEKPKEPTVKRVKHDDKQLAQQEDRNDATCTAIYLCIFFATIVTGIALHFYTNAFK